MTSASNLCSITTLAKLLGLTQRRVQQLAIEGHVIKGGRGEYDLVGSIRQYVAYCESRAQAKEGSVAEDSLSAARKRLIEVQTEKTTCELSILRGEWMAQTEVAALIESITERFIQGISALPGRLAVLLTHQRNPAVVRQHIQDECDALRHTLAQQFSTWISHYERERQKNVATSLTHVESLEDEEETDAE